MAQPCACARVGWSGDQPAVLEGNPAMWTTSGVPPQGKERVVTACRLSSAQRQKLPGLGINFSNALREPVSCESYHTMTLYLMHLLYVHFCAALLPRINWQHTQVGATA